MRKHLPTSKKLLTATLAFANISFSYKRLRQNDKALEAALEGLALYEQFPTLPKRWEQNLLFRKASALYALNDLQASFKVYQEFLKKYPSDNAAEHYNLACIYADWQDRSNMLSHLARAIALKSAHKAEAAADSDFQDYWQDPDFMALVKEE
jgi:tetratricopeptide (TPR) repeat protein